MNVKIICGLFLGGMIVIHGSIATAGDAVAKSPIIPEKSAEDILKQPLFRVAPEDILNVDVALPEKEITAISFEEASRIWGPIVEQLHSNNGGKRKAALELMALSFRAYLERTKKYFMMGETLITWSRMCPGRQNDALRCAVNDVIMLLDNDNGQTVGYALGGLLDLDLPRLPGDNRSTLMMRWQETGVFRKLIAPPAGSSTKGQGKH